MSTAPRPITRLLIANRGEIAIRVLRAANELGIATVAIFSEEDQLALHRFKADESYRVGEGLGPVKAYLAIGDVLRVAREAAVDAIHPGYGFLSENPDFAEACEKAGIAFVGPPAEVMRLLGGKVSGRAVAASAGVPVMPATGALPDDAAETARLAAEIGYPLMLKSSWGGGGRGMRLIETPDQLEGAVLAGRREAELACGSDEVYLEKLVRRARHIEVQVLGDRYGTLVHLFERDCSVQRRNQKVVERAPAFFLSEEQRGEICEAALRVARAAKYQNAGTVEFLMDADSGEFYFIEVNPRIQVEHTITEEITGIDLVKAQIRIAAGAKIGTPESGVPPQYRISIHGHALQCRVTTEDPDHNFIPDYGRIGAYRPATGFGIRLDGGTSYSGALITRFYDSLLEKVTAWAPTPDEAIRRMDRALREFRIRGVATNLTFLETLINHPVFSAGTYTTRFIDETPALFQAPERRDRASRLLNYIGTVTINGGPEKVGPIPADIRPPVPRDLPFEAPPGTRQLLEELGPKGFADWMRAQTRLLMTDTTLRDAHQSLIATRMRTHDMLAVAPAYARGLPGLLSLECWGGATFDVALRFLKEDPWDRLAELRARVPNLLLQMLLRSANAVGYTNYPDNVVRHFIQQSAKGGVDLFRVFDSLNWVENMRVAMDAVGESGKLCEAAICYTGDVFDETRPKYGLKYYVGLAKELEAAGAHILGIKDMAGLCRPAAASLLVKTLKQEIGLPIHFHTHDTSGISAASVLAAAEAGVDAADAAIDAMSGLTSQPNLGSIVAALAGTPRDTGLDAGILRQLTRYWEQVRRFYAGFESDIRSGTAEVYLHEMPGGQYTNLRQQAKAMGLEERWPQVAEAYAAVNRQFGDIIKVTPTSKVVGDLALTMVSSGLTEADLLDPKKDVAFPDSVVSFFRGDIGQPPGGFPAALQARVLRGSEPLTERPGAVLPPADLDAKRAEAEALVERPLSETDLASYLMYPKVFADFAKHERVYGDLSVLPTPVFFAGMRPGQEISIELERGKTLVIRCLAIGDPDDDGIRNLFFELNGQPRTVKIADKSIAVQKRTHVQAEENNPWHVAAPMPGVVSTIAVHPGQLVAAGEMLLSIEAMKMETAVTADRAGRVERIAAPVGTQIDVKDLLIVLAPAGD